MSLNVVVFEGRLTRDPELKHTANGLAIASFGIAVDDDYRKDENNKRLANFFDLTAFGKQAELITEHFKKGNAIAVQGAAQLEQWKNQEGENRSRVSFIVRNFSFPLGANKPANGENQTTEVPSSTPESGAPQTDDDIPF